MQIHTVALSWQGGMQFLSTNPSEQTFYIDTTPENGGNNQGMHPKALMLSALGGCTGLDITHLIKKMHLVVDELQISVKGVLSEAQPQTYTEVVMEYHFFGANLQHEQIERAVRLSVEKYCGVLKMFESFASVKTAIFYNE